MFQINVSKVVLSGCCILYKRLECLKQHQTNVADRFSSNFSMDRQQQFSNMFLMLGDVANVNFGCCKLYLVFDMLQ